MYIGVIKSFNPTRGFGFILPSSGGPDLFMHVNNLCRGVDEAEVREGAEVSYELGQGKKGAKAVVIRVIQQPGLSDEDLAKYIRVAANALDDLIVAARTRGWDV
jgi:cold shock protein